MSLTSLRERIPSRLSDFFNPWEEWLHNGKALFDGEWALSVPAANISEDKKSYHLTLAAPGLKKEDFDVRLDGDRLTISAEKEESKEEKDAKYSRKEYNYSSFSRSFTLPEEVLKDKIDIKYDNGVLSISLPKSEQTQSSTSRKLTVN